MKITILILFLSLCLGACRKQKIKEDPAGPGAAVPEAKVETDPDRRKVVARVGQRSITVGKLTDEINQQNPYIRMRYTSLEQRRRFLKSMIRFEVMAQEAQKRGLQHDPEVIRRVKRAMISQMMYKLRKELVKMTDITDKEIADYYQNNVKLYQQPEQIRVSQLLTRTEAEAKKVLAEALKKPKNPRHFAQLVRVHSIDKATLAQQGDLDFFARDNRKLPKPLVEAAFKISEMFGVTGPVKLEQGFALLMKTGYRTPRNRPLGLEKGNIRSRLYNVRQKKALKAFVEKLHKSAKVEIVEENLTKVKLKIRPVAPRPHGH